MAMPGGTPTNFLFRWKTLLKSLRRPTRTSRHSSFLTSPQHMHPLHLMHSNAALLLCRMAQVLTKRYQLHHSHGNCSRHGSLVQFPSRLVAILAPPSSTQALRSVPFVSHIWPWQAGRHPFDIEQHQDARAHPCRHLFLLLCDANQA